MQGPNANLMKNRAQMLVIAGPRPEIQEPLESLMDGLLAHVVIEVTHTLGIGYPVDDFAWRVGCAGLIHVVLDHSDGGVHVFFNGDRNESEFGKGRPAGDNRGPCDQDLRPWLGLLRRTAVYNQVATTRLRISEEHGRILVIAQEDSKMPSDRKVRVWEGSRPVDEFSMKPREVPPKRSLQLSGIN